MGVSPMDTWTTLGLDKEHSKTPSSEATDGPSMDLLIVDGGRQWWPTTAA